MIQTLQLIQNAGHHTAIVAGGAIRDMYHDVLISDIDIFIQHPGHMKSSVPVKKYLPKRPFDHPEWTAYWADVLRLRDINDPFDGDDIEWYYSSYEPPSAFDDEDDFTAEIISVWNVYRGLNAYQIVFTTIDPISYVNDHFDFGLCKAYCDGKRLHFTEDFMRDSRNKTITLVGKNMPEQRVKYAMLSHYPRIREKYPGHRLVVPDHYSV